MPITILSPYDGTPVKIRDQDISRAVRDRQGRIFYVLKRSDGSGYYSAMTRVGGEKDENRYLEMEAKVDKAHDNAREALAQVHDARGKPRSNIRGKLVVLILFLLVAALAWYAYTHLSHQWQPGPPANPIPIDPLPQPAPQDPPVPAPAPAAPAPAAPAGDGAMLLPGRDGWSYAGCWPEQCLLVIFPAELVAGPASLA